MQERSVVFYAPNQILSVSKVRLIELWRLSDENFKIFKFSYDYCVRLNNQISTDYKFPSLPATAPAWTVEFSNCGINVHLQFTMFRKSPNCLQPLNSPTGPLSMKIFANNHANIRWQCKKFTIGELYWTADTFCIGEDICSRTEKQTEVRTPPKRPCIEFETISTDFCKIGNKN